MRRFTMILAGLAAVAIPGPSAQSATLKLVRSVVDFARAGDAETAIEKLAGELAGSEPAIYVDLVLRPEQDASSKAWSYHVTAGNGLEITCIEGAESKGRLPRPGDELSFEFGAFYTHLLLTLELGGERQHPFNAAGCAMSVADPDVPELRIRGFFAVIETQVPTAYGIRLRSVSATDAAAALSLWPVAKASEP